MRPLAVLVNKVNVRNRKPVPYVPLIDDSDVNKEQLQFEVVINDHFRKS